MVESFNPPMVWAPFGTFSMLALQGAGHVVHLKGQVALDRDGGVVGKDDMPGQTRQTMENLQAVLESIGGAMHDIVSLTHYVTDIDAFMKTRDVRRQFFTGPYPVTTTIQVVRLYNPDLLIEISAIAEIPLGAFNDRRRAGPPREGIRPDHRAHPDNPEGVSRSPGRIVRPVPRAT